MELRNIHFQPEPDPAPATSPVVDPADVRMRVRPITVSPAEEYALRSGEVQPISDALASLILSCKGYVEVTLKWVKVDRADLGGKRFYRHEDSIVLNDLSYRSRKVCYVINRRDPSVIHLLDETGRYIETLPELVKPGVLNNEEQAREAASLQRQSKRITAHLQRTHGKDTQEALERLRENNNTMQRVVQALPAPAAEPAKTEAPSGLGNQIQRAGETIKANRIRTTNAVSFGRAVSMSESQAPARYTPPVEAEDWSRGPRIEQPVAAEEWPAEPVETSPTNISPEDWT